MNKIATTAAVLGGLTLVGCGGDETTDPGARVESLCRDWCTCSGNANPSCLDQCIDQTTETRTCEREESVRYYGCMVDRQVEGECLDPFDDCVSDFNSESYQTCFQETQERCTAQCEGTPTCMGTDENGIARPAGDCIEVCRYGGTCEQAVACYDFRTDNPESNCHAYLCWAYGTGVCELP